MDVPAEFYGRVSEILSAELLAACEKGRPSTIHNPRIYKDGSQWCALLGENLQVGIAGFGDTPAAACTAFDRAWYGR